MTDFSRHGEWLSLIDVSGPFLAEPVLKQAFPQGLEQADPLTRKLVRQAYDEWREAIDADDPDSAPVHDAWIELVLKRVLELDENGEEDVLKPKGALPESIAVSIPEHEVTLCPDYAVVDGQNDGLPLMFVTVYPPDTDLSARVKGDSWAASPVERMVELCHARDVRLGLVTDGERWTLVDAPIGGVTSNARWYARLWGQEPITLQAFVNLLGIRRFFVDDSERLPSLLDESLKLQEEVTDALGEQVRRAVEVLVQRLDRADLDLNRELLIGVEPTEIYEAALTVMMRVVFLLSAEERGLLLLDDEAYQTNYAVSTLRMQLRAESEEILERRQDAWSRLLAIFRAVFGGIEHEALKLPALGGSLFDPDRFPFLEGRVKDTSWKEHPAAPLPIDNRTVLLLLDAVQLFEGRTLSYRALDIEQIGYVYEGLLERTVVRAREVTLDLDATKSAKNPWVTLNELESAATAGESAVQALLEDRTGSSSSRVKNDLAKSVDEAAVDRLLTACHGSQTLRDRIRPYLHFLRMDRWGYPLVYPEGTFMVTAGMNRRETGTHYTPKSLTEAIVKETLEPLVYIGPADGVPRKDWRLRPSREILDLKICDPAMGSGAFLVQVCRWLSERLVEAWDEAERAGQAITSEGAVVDEIGELEPLRDDSEDRMLVARRLIAERCLYGIDMNALAVELAKLSIWLITLAKGRPFGFLDHNLRCGDSLLGIHDLDQLLYLDMAPGKGSSKKLFAATIDAAVERALELRAELRDRSIRDIHDIEFMASLDERARQELKIPHFIADAFIGDIFAGGIGSEPIALSIEAGKAIDDPHANAVTLARRARNGLRTDLPVGMRSRQPFHWPLAFPEVFRRENGGFDAMVGNPPFLGGVRISEIYGDAYNDFLAGIYDTGRKVDICAFFFRRSFSLLRKSGVFGLLATNTISQGTTRKAGLTAILSSGGTIVFARPSFVWPGKASVVASLVICCRGPWHGERQLSGFSVSFIGDLLFSQEETDTQPTKLRSNHGLCFQGSSILGKGFFLTPNEAKQLIEAEKINGDVVKPVYGGKELNNRVESEVNRWIVDFYERDEQGARKYQLPFDLIESRVKPERLKKDSEKYPRLVRTWWKYWHSRRKLYDTISRDDMDRVLARSRVSDHHMVDFLPTGIVYTEQLVVFLLTKWSDFSVLQSSIHDIWSRRYASTMKNDVRYIPTDCFETFPRPQFSEKLEKIGSSYWSARQAIKRERSCGLTKLYNKFHDPNDLDPELHTLRELHIEMDLTVWTAYGLDTTLLDHDFYETNRGIRFCPSEGAQDHIVGTLLEMNLEKWEANNICDNSALSVQGDGVGAKVDRAAQHQLFDDRTNGPSSGDGHSVSEQVQNGRRLL